MRLRLLLLACLLLAGCSTPAPPSAPPPPNYAREDVDGLRFWLGVPQTKSTDTVWLTLAIDNNSYRPQELKELRWKLSLVSDNGVKSIEEEVREVNLLPGERWTHQAEMLSSTGPLRGRVTYTHNGKKVDLTAVGGRKP